MRASQARYKFIFIHQLVGGTDEGGRGGNEVAPLTAKAEGILDLFDEAFARDDDTLLNRQLLLFFLYTLFGSALPAAAHDLALSGIKIAVRQNDTLVSVMTPISRLLRSEGAGRTILTPVELDQAIRKRLHVRLDGRELSVRNAKVNGDYGNDIVFWQANVPYPARECEVTARIYPEDPGARTLVTVLRGDRIVQEVMLDTAHSQLSGSFPSTRPLSVAMRFIQEGIFHIYSGWDHILFILGLLLLVVSLRNLLKTVTAFTLAHSITLSLAATGICNPSPRIIEPLIALSIVAVAVENLRHVPEMSVANRKPRQETPSAEALSRSSDRRTRDLRPYFAFGFGLIHGFGFAGALAEVGLPRIALGTALASFNIGVELGQITIILAAMPFLTLLAGRSPRLMKLVVITGSIAIGTLGAFWFFNRLHSGTN